MIEKSIFSDDLLGRDDELENLSMLIEGTAEPLTLAINAAWGAGKTTFVKELWQPHLAEEHGIESFYFSAWENDYSDEPLISILGEFKKYLKDKNKKITSDLDEIVSIAADISKSAFVQSVKKATGDIIDISSLVEGYSSAKDDVKKFKKKIPNLLDSIYGDQSDKKPFVIFVDELDRCRPLYAIEFLERIKHLFGVKRLIFVLSIDKAQLAESIKSQYGNIDIDNYLRRFIDLEYQLPAGNLENFCGIKINQFRLINILEEKYTRQAHFSYNRYDDFFFMQAKIFKTSLRTIEQILLRLNIIFKCARPELIFEHFIIITFFTFIKFYDSNLYHKLIYENEKNAIKRLLNQHEENIKNKNSEASEIQFLQAIVDVMGLNVYEFNSLIKESSNNKKSITIYPYEFLVVDSTVSSFGSGYKLSLKDFIDEATKLIDFADKFTL